jgi:hypothetical protein
MAVVLLAAAGGLYALVQHQREADFRPLFTGVAPEDASAIVQKLKESGVDYRVPEEGGMVLVPSARLAELRINMAAAGLPKTGRIGFRTLRQDQSGRHGIHRAHQLPAGARRRVGAVGDVPGGSGAGARPYHLPQGFRVSRIAAAGQGQRFGKAPAGQPAGAAERAGDRPPGSCRGGGPDARCRFRPGHEWQSPGPAQIARPIGRTGAFRGCSGLPPSCGDRPVGESQFHPGAAAGGGEISRQRFRGMRFHRGRTERRSLRSGAFRDEQFAAHGR